MGQFWHPDVDAHAAMTVRAAADKPWAAGSSSAKSLSSSALAAAGASHGAGRPVQQAAAGMAGEMKQRFITVDG